MNTHSETYLKMDKDQRRFVKGAFDEGFVIGICIATAILVVGYLMFGEVSTGKEIVLVLK